MKRLLRAINSAEIQQLVAQGCSAESWDEVWVPEVFDIEQVVDVHFSGTVCLGAFRKSFTLPGGLVRHSGVRHATLHNVTLGDDVLIEQVHNYIANYRIGRESIIQHVNLLLVEGRSCFGNNVEVSVLNETGGREVPIYEGLAAALAYLIALYRHRPQLSERLRQLIAD